jgi:FtsP/CotA-like multicopper oxidase with cupredoxin domain
MINRQGLKMNKTKLFTAIALAIGISTLTACGGGGSTTTPTSLIGSAFKGPIDGAVTTVTDATGVVIATGSSSNGKFEFPAITLPSDGGAAVFIETQGGSYTDEATDETVTATGKGLMTVFTVDDLTAIIAGEKVMALTPETTLMAILVKKLLAAGKTASEAITEAKATIQAQLIDDTNPAQGTSGDALLLTGDLSAATPADQAEALARNRAISFSLEANALNLSPVQVFDLIDKRALDLEDGTLDGKEDGTTAITIEDKDGATKELGADQKNSYGLARTKLLNNTLTRLGNGELSDAEKAELEKLGFDTGYFDDLNAANAAAEAKTVEQLAATNLPAFNILPVLTDEDGDLTDNNATYTLTATPNVSVNVTAPGESWTTPMLRYNGLQLPPVIKVNRGDSMTLNLVNNLADETTIHWHGFKIPADQDGGADFPVAAGASKTYSFQMLQPAAPLWFHPHPDMKTGEQVYNGLAGVYLLDDDISKKLVTDKNLPADTYDIPVLIQDRRFKDDADADGVTDGVRELLYKMNADGTANEMDNDGMLGGTILVNGAELPTLNVETRQYRFRLYNTSNARSYEFALTDDGTTFKSFKVIGTDGGLLAQPVDVDSITLGAAERAEIIIDFGSYAADSKLMLVSKAFNGSPMTGMSGMGNGGMGSGGMGNSGTENSMDGMTVNGKRIDIMRFDVTTAVTDDVVLYTDLPADADINTQRLAASDASKTRNFVMTMAMGDMNGGGGMSFVINGAPFDMNVINETVTLADGDTEIWSIQNRSPMAHPFHAHAIQWQILDRNGVAATGVDLGWKDTVLVQPGETVNFIGKFDPIVNYGDYMYHCHILEHEDAGMMGFFRIQ